MLEQALAEAAGITTLRLELYDPGPKVEQVLRALLRELSADTPAEDARPHLSGTQPLYLLELLRLALNRPCRRGRLSQLRRDGNESASRAALLSHAGGVRRSLACGQGRGAVALTTWRSAEAGPPALTLRPGRF